MNIPQQVSDSVRRRNPHLYPSAPQTHAEAPTTHFDGAGGIKTPKRIRQSQKPLLNKLESEFQRYLAMIYADGTTPHATVVTTQALRFNLANGLWYKPDFVVFTDRILAYEVKGVHAFRGGFENLKMAARLYQFIFWRLTWKENGQWISQEVLP